MKTIKIIIAIIITIFLNSCNENKTNKQKIKKHESKKILVNKEAKQKEDQSLKVIANELIIKSADYQPVHKHFCQKDKFNILASFIKGDAIQNGYKYKEMKFKIENLDTTNYKIKLNSVNVTNIKNLTHNKIITVKLEIVDAGKTPTNASHVLKNTSALTNLKKNDVLDMRVFYKDTAKIYDNCSHLAPLSAGAPGSHFCQAIVKLKK